MQLSAIESVARRYDEIYVSPHLDDVVLSCAGRILLAGQVKRSILVVTVFTAEPPGIDSMKKEIRDRVGDMAERRREDLQAMQRLGVDFLWLDHYEATFRDKRYQNLYGVFFRSWRGDSDLSIEIAGQIEKICRMADAERIYLPLGVGNHADHRLLFEVGVRLGKLGKREYVLCYYEDAPYAFITNLLLYRMKAAGVIDVSHASRQEQSLWNAAAETYSSMLRLSSVKAQLSNRFLRAFTYLFIAYRFAADTAWWRRNNHGMRLSSEICDIGPVLDAKLDAISQYRSQIGPLLGDLTTYVQLIADYSRGLGGGNIVERVWRIVE